MTPTLSQADYAAGFWICNFNCNSIIYSQLGPQATCGLAVSRGAEKAPGDKADPN
jgi:hypothetical protein